MFAVVSSKRQLIYYITFKLICQQLFYFIFAVCFLISRSAVSLTIIPHCAKFVNRFFDIFLFYFYRYWLFSNFHCAHKIKVKREASKISLTCFSSYVREKIRTPDTLVRSQVLYPAELRTHIPFSNIYYITLVKCSQMLMPATGIEPVLYFYNRILSPARLPVPPRRHFPDSAFTKSMEVTGLEPVTLCL